MKHFSLVVAATPKGGIGYQGRLPWRIPADMAFFKKLTTTAQTVGRKNVVIMGRKTWESIPSKFRPLPGRINVVLTRKTSLAEDVKHMDDVHVSNSFESALELVSDDLVDQVDDVFVIGGAQIYEMALKSRYCERVYLTSVLQDFECDTFLSLPFKGFSLDQIGDVKFDNDVPFQFNTYIPSTFRAEDVPVTPARVREHKAVLTSESGTPLPTTSVEENSGQNRTPQEEPGNPEEQQYLDLVRRVIETGTQKGDRTGTGTLSIFGAQCRYNLRNTFPLLTTKRVFWRGVVEELLWLVRGCTDSKELAERKVHIWDANGSREFLDQQGHTDREEGDLGPVYGFQWRHFGANYTTYDADYTGQGRDQLQDVIDLIKNNPNSRRILLNAWNAADLDQMALPPCHCMAQFYVANGELSCQMYQRSCDLGLGVPFNIASYSLLTIMLAQVCGLKPGEFVHTMGDAHVYLNHVEPLTEQLKRTPRAFPKLNVNKDVTDIENFTYGDFELVGYKPMKTIKMKMAV